MYSIGDAVIVTDNIFSRYVSYDGTWTIEELNKGHTGKVCGFTGDIKKIRVDIDNKTWEIDLEFLRPYSVDEKSTWKEKGLCPQCGESGFFIALGFVCSKHGPY